MRPGFGFDDVADLAPYLSDLGISHAYLSPVIQAAPGSDHGYDVVDPSRLNAELGGREAFDRMTKCLHDAGLGIILDIVPNHMAIAGRHNAWWWDVLENGPSSRYASFFDIDWDPPEASLRSLVLVPVLGDHYGRVLEAGDLQLVRHGGSFTIRYFEHEVPVSPRSLDDLLARAAREAASGDLNEIAVLLGQLPHAESTDRASVEKRHRDKEVLRSRLEELLRTDASAATAVDAEVGACNGDPDRLDALVTRQNWRLSHWRTAVDELDYRRFFDVSTLVGLRMEREEVFAATHALVLSLVSSGDVDGLRIDHPDGLRDPTGYLDLLRAEVGDAFVVVEKILERDEQLPPWPVHGTTGYDFMNRALGVFVDADAEGPLTDLYARFTGEAGDMEAIAHAARHEVMASVLAADIERLVSAFRRVADRHRRHRDHRRRELRDALVEVLACFPVYRSYVRADAAPSHDDRRHVHRAVDAARIHRPDIDAELLSFLSDVLLLRVDGRDERDLALRFQQVCAAVTAKGVEDTAFYRYHRFVALNEVGGDPGGFGMTVDQFHEHNVRIAGAWPRTMLATSTHDTKRSEDVRARLAVISEDPAAWEEVVWRWAHANENRRGGELDRATEYLLYQVLAGAHPIDSTRAVAYALKAAREAKRSTSWLDPNEAYEGALRGFLDAALADPSFTGQLDGVAADLAVHGRANSLAQTVLKLTCPGVPDVYQGTELWDLSLVDPDNRRAVDFAVRSSLLDAGDAGAAGVDLKTDETGASKLHVMRAALGLRRDHPASFDAGASYDPMAARGAAANHLIAYRRGADVIAAVTRLPLGLRRRGGWGGTSIRLPDGTWRDAFGGGVHRGDVGVGELFESLPVAILRRS